MKAPEPVHVAEEAGVLQLSEDHEGIIDLPADARKPGRPEPALILAITRQESEFDPRAHSSAGARGLMQIMPATARITARTEGLPYQPNWLVDDPSYNVTLGAAYLQHLLESWNGSYVLTIASYNAGPGRPREWIGDWGDPRASNADVVDWVELIPFSETRNYVQRVIENLGVYRVRFGTATSAPANAARPAPPGRPCCAPPPGAAGRCSAPTAARRFRCCRRNRLWRRTPAPC